MVSCAVIGSNGYLGKHLVEYLRHKGMAVSCYDICNVDANHGRCIDITDKRTLAGIDLDVDLIFMFAGITGTYAGFANYSLYNNINEIGLINLLDTIRNSQYRPKVVFPSSRLVYKGVDRPLKETDTKECKTIYAVNKLACENLLWTYRCSFDIPFTVFRICVPYGNLLPGPTSYGTIGHFIHQAADGKDITLYGGGLIKRTFTYIEDLCDQIVRCSMKNESNGEAYNIGGETLSLRQVASMIAKLYNTNVVSVPWPEADLRIESDSTYFDDTKIQSLLGAIEYKRFADYLSDVANISLK